MNKRKKDRLEQRQEVLGFIKRFTKDGERKEVIECFSGECGYYFANAIWLRFGNLLFEKDETIEMMYDRETNHFGCKVNDRVYDITGDVTDKYNWESWIVVARNDTEFSEQVNRDFINF